MKWARNIAGIMALATLLFWATCFVVTVCLEFSTKFYMQIDRGRWEFRWYGESFDDAHQVQVYTKNPGGPIWPLPRFGNLDWRAVGGKGVDYWAEFPHWLTNLVAWSLFIVLWRKCRKPPKGHCQKCGYNLTGNTTGRCPECNTDSLTAKP